MLSFVDLCTGVTQTVSGSQGTHTYQMAAEVSLISRNIRIVGAEYDRMMEESFGARVLVGQQLDISTMTILPGEYMGHILYNVLALLFCMLISVLYKYSSPPLIGIPLPPNNSVLIRNVSFGERED